MAQARTIGELLEIEEAVENASKDILQQLGIKNVYTQRENEEASNPRVNIQVKKGKATGLRLQDNHDIWWLSQWNATLSFQIVSNRSKDANEVWTHRKIRGAINEFCSKCNELDQPIEFSQNVLPFHAINTCLDLQSIPITQGDDNQDVSELHFSIVVQIRNNAFPA